MPNNEEDFLAIPETGGGLIIPGTENAGMMALAGDFPSAPIAAEAELMPGCRMYIADGVYIDWNMAIGQQQAMFPELGRYSYVIARQGQDGVNVAIQYEADLVTIAADLTVPHMRKVMLKLDLATATEVTLG